MNVSVEQLDEDSSPDTVENWDSLKHMSLILALEEEFDITFSDDEIIRILSVKNTLEILKGKSLTNLDDKLKSNE